MKILSKLEFRLWLSCLPNELDEILIDGSHTVNGRGEVHEFLRGLGFLQQKKNNFYRGSKLAAAVFRRYLNF